MKQIAVMCVAGVLCGALVAGCGGRKPEQTGLPAVYEGDPNVSLQAVDACRSADGEARRALMSIHMDVAERNDDLIKMIKACRPIMSSFNVNSPNPRIAETARTCKQAYETKLRAYQKRADGDLSEEAVDLMSRMIDQHVDCVTAEEKLDGTYKPLPPDETPQPTDDSPPKSN